MAAMSLASSPHALKLTARPPVAHARSARVVRAASAVKPASSAGVVGLGGGVSLCHQLRPTSGVTMSAGRPAGSPSRASSLRIRAMAEEAANKKNEDEKGAGIKQLLGVRGGSQTDNIWKIRLQLTKPVTWVPLIWGVMCGAAASGHYTWTFDNVGKALLCMVMSGPLLTGRLRAHTRHPQSLRKHLISLPFFPSMPRPRKQEPHTTNVSCHFLHTPSHPCTEALHELTRLVAADTLMCACAHRECKARGVCTVVRTPEGSIRKGSTVRRGYTQTINDWYDREIDAINEPNRPIPSGAISEFDVQVPEALSPEKLYPRP